jgi:exopolysaccharide biosynthesis protein
MRERLWIAKRLWFRIASLMLTLALLTGQTVVLAANNVAPVTEIPIKLISETKIGEGTFLKTYEKTINGKVSKIYLVQIDLNNQYVKVAPIYGKGGKIAKQPLSKMANENGAIAAVNANFFHLTQRPAPFAMELKDGELITSQSVLHDWMVFGITPDKNAMIGTVGFKGQVLAADGTTYPIFNLNKELHGTHAGDSHVDRLNLYNSRWVGNSIGMLPGKTGVVEVVVENDQVQEIRVDQPGVPIPPNGYVLMGHGVAGKYLLEHMKVGDPVKISYGITPETLNLEQGIGAHALLVDQGIAVPIAPKTYFEGMKYPRARSAVGISQDGKTVYLVSLEKSASSEGVTLDTFGRILAELGIWRAANLDGGGSTTLVARKPADTAVSVINTPEGGSQREVPDGIGVFNLAPPGALAGMILNHAGMTNLLVGSQFAYPLKAYDEHILPYNVYQDPIQWTSSNPQVGDFKDGKFIAKAPGSTEVRAAVGSILSNAIKINVFGGKDIAKVEVTPTELALRTNNSYPLTLKVTTKNGLTFNVNPENVQWTIEGVDGAMKDLTYNAGSVPGMGKIKGNIDGFTFTVPVRQGTILSSFNTLENVKDYGFSHYPGGKSGSFVRVDVGSGEPVFRGNSAMKLTYNFAQNVAGNEEQLKAQVEAAYGEFNTNLTFPDKAFGVGVWVYGDNSRHMLRTQIKDAAGKVHLVTLAEKIDWTGWKYVEAPFPAGVKYPVSLKSLYVADTPNLNDLNRPITGNIYFDEVMALMPYDPAKLAALNPVAVEIGDKTPDIKAPFGTRTLQIPVKEIGKFATNVTITPVDIYKYEQPIPGVEPYAHGFKLDLAMKADGQVAKFPILISASAGETMGLIHWSPQEGKWKEITGFPNWQNQWRFDVEGSGLYVPIKKQNAFTLKDVSTHWAKYEIARMNQLGIIKGVNVNEFLPNAQLTRGEYVTLLYRIIEKQKPAVLESLSNGAAIQFKDAIPEWAAKGVAAAVQLQIVNGFEDQTFRASLGLTREQLAAIIARTVANLNISLPESKQEMKLADEAKIPEWAKQGARIMAEQGLIPIQGNQFLPKQPVTRGEAAYAIAKLYDWLGNAQP